MVSGFPTLVMEGVVLTVLLQRHQTAFRSNRYEVRHPRSAVGLTADKQRLIMVAVDGQLPITVACMGLDCRTDGPTWCALCREI